jgi:hypothetical protein
MIDLYVYFKTMKNFHVVGKKNANHRTRDGTQPIGEAHPNVKISKEVAKQIKKSRGDGRTMLQRSQDFNVSFGTISDIDYGQSWSSTLEN